MWEDEWEERTVWGQLEDSPSETLLYVLGLEASVGVELVLRNVFEQPGAGPGLRRKHDQNIPR